MKTSNESSQQASKIGAINVQFAKKLVFTYPLGASNADIDRSIKYYVGKANENLAMMGSNLRVSVDPIIVITPDGNSKTAEVTGSHIDWIMKGGVPNPPPPPSPPIIPPDSFTYVDFQINPGIKNSVIKSKMDIAQSKLVTDSEIASHLNTKQG